MTDPLAYAFSLAQTFGLVLLRVTGILILAPVFGSRGVPASFKAALALFLAFILLPLVPEAGELSTFEFALWGLGEMAVGLSMGFLMTVVLSAVQVAGQFIDVQMGFGMVNVMEPQFSTPVPLIGNFLHFLTLLVFLSLEGHHLVLRALVESYRLVPMGSVSVADSAGAIVEVFSYSFAVALQMALPVVGALFLADVALGVIARTVPQMNVFVVGLPLKILGGSLVLLVFLPGYLYFIRVLVEKMQPYLWGFLGGLGG